MRIGITGASGFIGSAIIERANADGHIAIGFSRSAGKIIPGCEEVRDFSDPENADYKGLDAIIHLAGESILGVWTSGKKKRIYDSRIDGTAALVRGIGKIEQAKRPNALVCASGIGYYGDRGDDILDEEEDRGFGFLAKVVEDWEEAAQVAAEKHDVRVVTPRIGFVLGKSGGALKVLKLIFKCCLGGRLGSGKQWMPWVHIDDIAGIFLKSATSDLMRGPVNAAAPNPVNNREFTKALAGAVSRPAFIPTPAFALKMLPGGMSEMFLNSQRANPAALKLAEYKWEFTDVDVALADLIES